MLPQIHIAFPLIYFVNMVLDFALQSQDSNRKLSISNHNIRTVDRLIGGEKKRHASYRDYDDSDSDSDSDTSNVSDSEFSDDFGNCKGSPTLPPQLRKTAEEQLRTILDNEDKCLAEHDKLVAEFDAKQKLNSTNQVAQQAAAVANVRNSLTEE